MNKETWVNHLLGLAKLEKNIGKKVAFEASADMIKDLEQELAELKSLLPEIKADAVLEYGKKCDSVFYSAYKPKPEEYANKLRAGE